MSAVSASAMPPVASSVLGSPSVSASAVSAQPTFAVLSNSVQSTDQPKKSLCNWIWSILSAIRTKVVHLVTICWNRLRGKPAIHHALRQPRFENPLLLGEAPKQWREAQHKFDSIADGRRLIVEQQGRLGKYISELKIKDKSDLAELIRISEQLDHLDQSGQKIETQQRELLLYLKSVQAQIKSHSDDIGGSSDAVESRDTIAGQRRVRLHETVLFLQECKGVAEGWLRQLEEHLDCSKALRSQFDERILCNAIPIRLAFQSIQHEVRDQLLKLEAGMKRERIRFSDLEMYEHYLPFYQWVSRYTQDPDAARVHQQIVKLGRSLDSFLIDGMGLPNLNRFKTDWDDPRGNSCWMNSVLMALFANEEAIKSPRSVPQGDNDPRVLVYDRIQAVYAGMRKGEDELKKALEGLEKTLAGLVPDVAAARGEYQDFKPFLLLALNALGMEFIQSNTRRAFGGKEAAESTERVRQSVLEIAIPIPRSAKEELSFETLIHNTMQEEVNDKDRAWRVNEKMTVERYMIQTRVTEAVPGSTNLPTVLPMMFKRVTYTGTTPAQTKALYALELELRDRRAEILESEPTEGEMKAAVNAYRRDWRKVKITNPIGLRLDAIPVPLRGLDQAPSLLQADAFIYHAGAGSEVGHYVACRRRRTDNKWIEYNDSAVKEMDEREASEKLATAYYVQARLVRS